MTDEEAKNRVEKAREHLLIVCELLQPFCRDDGMSGSWNIRLAPAHETAQGAIAFFRKKVDIRLEVSRTNMVSL